MAHQWIVHITVLICIFTPSTFPLVNRGSLANGIWDTFQPKLGRLVDSFERICVIQNVEFERAKVEEDLQRCFHDPMKDLTTMIGTRNSGESILLVHVVEKLKTGYSLLSQREINVLKTHLVEPICYFSTAILNCFNPHYTRIVEECTSDTEGKAMQYSDQIIVSACKGNGSKLIDFLESGGIECINPYLNHATECLANQSISFSDSMDLLKRGRTPNSVDELCSDLEKVHNCIAAAEFDICGKSEPRRIISAILRDVQSWTTNACSLDGAGRDDSGKRQSAMVNGQHPGGSYAGSRGIVNGIPFVLLLFLISHSYLVPN